MTEQFDIVIIGAGMAGASLAAEVAPFASVLIVEAEDAPGFHATGRSAAFWEECYGGPDIVPLTRASGSYLREHGFLNQRGALYIARGGQETAVAEFMERYSKIGVPLEQLTRAELESAIPLVRSGWEHGIRQPNCADIDVGGLHQHYLTRAKASGAVLRNRHRLSHGEREGSDWRLDFGKSGEIRSGIVVNAAGAWADEVARACGAMPLGIAAYRRTVVQMACATAPPHDLPLVLDLAGGFYFKPENGRLWLSPHDETPSAPCDAAPEEIDIAHAVDRFEQVVDWKIERLERKWAGLRSFLPDRLPAYGYDSAQDGFFWCAGQGGFGIQTAPAAGRLAGQLLLDKPRDEMTADLNAALYAPSRLG